ncbi:MAG TPA: acyltransferase family protein [Candidatus Omnitrophota bacterium]|nr:acyltransferase family protein [Candidatus Omnitrophota bacterium]
MSDIKKGRITSIDSFKVIAIFAVICIHTRPFKYSGISYLNDNLLFISKLINVSCRFAVPFFFIVTGYFWGEALKQGEKIEGLLKKTVLKLVKSYLFWMTVYAFFPEGFMDAILKDGLLIGLKKSFEANTLVLIKEHLLGFVLRGTSFHLWFIPALLFAVIFLALCIKLRKAIYILPISIALYVLGLVGGTYSKFFSGLPFTYDTRNGPFMGTLFVALGWVFSYYGVKKYVNWYCAFLVLCVGLVMQLIEFKMSGFLFDYAIGTVPYASGFFLLALSKPEMKFFIYNLGRFTAGIYFAHIFFLNLFLPFQVFVLPWVWDLTFCFVIMFATSGAVLLMQKNKLLKQFVL